MFAIKRELKLNQQQKSYFAACAGFSRFVYNYGLTLMKESWNFEGIKAGDSKRINTIKKVLTNVTKKQEKFAWTHQYSSRIYGAHKPLLRKAGSAPHQNSFIALKKAFSHWREGRTEIPQFKKKRHECSFTVDSSNGKCLVSEGKLIKIPTLGTFKLKEPIPFNCISQTFTLSRQADQWFVSFCVEAEIIPEMKHSQQRVGCDLGVKTFATLSNGHTLDTPSSLKKAKIKLSKTQWRNRSKVLGNRSEVIKTSNNAVKYYQLLRRKHRQITNIREDFLQKATTELAKTYQEIKIEDLNVRGMMANHKLSDALSKIWV